jgi:hypothetical protein
MSLVSTPLITLPPLPTAAPVIVNLEVGKPFIKRVMAYLYDEDKPFSYQPLGAWAFRLECNGTTLSPQPNRGAGLYLPIIQKLSSYEINRDVIGPPYNINLEVKQMINGMPPPGDIVRAIFVFEVYFSKANRVRIVGSDGASPDGLSLLQDPFYPYLPGKDGDK